MRRFLLLGVLFVASTALAFGGGGSSHRSLYRGKGVNSIGVHFGGDSPKKCSDGIQCGSGCCYGNDICTKNNETGEYTCCNNELNKCCSVDETAFKKSSQAAPTCCNGTVYNPIVDADGVYASYKACCVKGATIYGPFTEVLEIADQYVCCQDPKKPYILQTAPSARFYSCCDPDKLSYGTGPDGSDECLQ